MTLTKIRDTTAGIAYILYGTIKVAASDTYATATGGVALSFAPIAKATRPPLWVQFDGNSGYTYDYNQGTNAQNGTMRIRTSAGAEMADGAPIAAVQNDTIRFRAEFVGML